MALIDDILAEARRSEQVEVEQVDWDAPEAGQFPPRITPGIHDFVFRLEDSNDSETDMAKGVPFALVEIPKGAGRKFLQVSYKAEQVNGNDPQKPVILRFQRCSNYRHEKMQISQMADLVRSMGQKLGDVPTVPEYTAFFQAQDGTARFRGEVGWRRFCKACNITVSTHPRKAETKWPRTRDNKPVELIACPGCNDKGYGREEIVRFRLPEKADAF